MTTDYAALAKEFDRRIKDTSNFSNLAHCVRVHSSAISGALWAMAEDYPAPSTPSPDDPSPNPSLQSDSFAVILSELQEIKAALAQLKPTKGKEEHQREDWRRDIRIRNQIITQLRSALRQVNIVLTVPAAEYVPAIRDAFGIIDGALAASDNKETTL